MVDRPGGVWDDSCLTAHEGIRIVTTAKEPKKTKSAKPGDRRTLAQDIVLLAAGLAVPAVLGACALLLEHLTDQGRRLFAAMLCGLAIGLTVAFAASLLSGFTTKLKRSVPPAPAKVWLYPIGVATAWVCTGWAVGGGSSFPLFLGVAFGVNLVAFGVPMMRFIVGADRPARVRPRDFALNLPTIVNPMDQAGWTYIQWAAVAFMVVLLLIAIVRPEVRDAFGADLERVVPELIEDGAVQAPPAPDPGTPAGAEPEGPGPAPSPPSAATSARPAFTG